MPTTSNDSTYSISLLLSPLPSEEYESDSFLRTKLCTFSTNPGLQKGDWVYIRNYESMSGKHVDLKAIVVKQQVQLICQNDMNGSNLEVEIFLEAENRDFIIEETAKVDETLNRRKHRHS